MRRSAPSHSRLNHAATSRRSAEIAGLFPPSWFIHTNDHGVRRLARDEDANLTNREGSLAYPGRIRAALKRIVRAIDLSGAREVLLFFSTTTGR